MRRFVGFLLFSFPLFGQTDFAPHTMTYESSNQPFVASASTWLGSFEPWKAFDSNSGGTYWLGQNAGVDSLKLDTGGVGGSYVLTSYAIKVNTIPEPNRAPKNWTMQGSQDNSSWTTLDTETNQTSWTSGQTRTFTLSNSTAYRYYRLNISSNNGDATYTQVADLFLYSTATIVSPVDLAVHNMTTDSSHSPYVASASTNSANAFKAFDGSDAVEWLGTGGGTDILELDLGSASYTAGYTIAGSLSALNRSPKAWTFQGSNDNSAWTTLDTKTNQITWSPIGASFGKLSFPVSGAGSYRYYRVNITANNGDGTNDAITELYIWQGSAPAGSATQAGAFLVGP